MAMRRWRFFLLLVLAIPVGTGMLASVASVTWYRVAYFDPQLPPVGVESIQLLAALLAAGGVVVAVRYAPSGHAAVRTLVGLGLALWAFIRTQRVEMIWFGKFGACCCCLEPITWSELLRVTLNPFDPFWLWSL